MGPFWGPFWGPNRGRFRVRFLVVVWGRSWAENGRKRARRCGSRAGSAAWAGALEALSKAFDEKVLIRPARGEAGLRTPCGGTPAPPNAFDSLRRAILDAAAALVARRPPQTGGRGLSPQQCRPWRPMLLFCRSLLVCIWGLPGTVCGHCTAGVRQCSCGLRRVRPPVRPRPPRPRARVTAEPVQHAQWCR